MRVDHAPPEVEARAGDVDRAVVVPSDLDGRDAAVGQHVLAQLARELRLPPLHVRVQEALEDGAEEV